MRIYRVYALQSLIYEVVPETPIWFMLCGLGGMDKERNRLMSNSVVVVTSQQYKSECADIVIIGNGIAGLTAALEARDLAPSASIAVITDQSHPTINTPAL